MTDLKIAEELSLPLDTVTQAIAILAKRRAGKSYLARRFAEQLHFSGQQLVVVDPKGDWWGMRSMANGTSAGIPIIILGGDHGDLPIEASAGTVVAKLTVEEHVSVLLDLSLLRKHEVATFMTAFLEELYRLKARAEYRTPVMLIIDEADAVAPQKPQPNEMRMLGAANDIVRRGGQRGIGCTLITQRSAVLSKDVLTQVQMLVTLRTMSPQDLAAVRAWIDVHGTVGQQKELMASLPSLPIGTAWFWSPGWPTDAGIFVRSKVLPIRTFDSGATPKAGETTIAPKLLAGVDLGAVQRSMADAIEQAKENDPKALKEEVKRLRAQIAAGSTGTVINKTQAEALVRSLGDRKRALTRLTQVLTDVSQRQLSSFNELTATVKAMSDFVAADTSSADVEAFLDDLEPSAPPPQAVPERRRPRPEEPRLPTRATRARIAAEANKSHGGLPIGEFETLKVISSKKGGANINFIVLVTGYRAGSIKSYTNRLVTRGLVRREKGLFFSTNDGLLVAPPSKLPKGDDLIEHYRRTLPAGEGQVLGALRRLHPIHANLVTVTRACDGLAEGSVKSYLNRLATRGLVLRESGNNWLSGEFNL